MLSLHNKLPNADLVLTFFCRSSVMDKKRKSSADDNTLSVLLSDTKEIDSNELQASTQIELLESNLQIDTSVTFHYGVFCDYHDWKKGPPPSRQDWKRNERLTIY